MNIARIASFLAAAGLAVVAIGAPPAESRVYIQFQPGGKGLVKQAIAAAGGRVHHEFDQLGAVAVTVPQAALDGLSRNPHVVLIEEDPVRELYGQTTPYGIDLVQARDLWDANRDGVIDGGAATGAGVTVGVIDSGVFATHPDFAGVAIAGEPAGNPSTDEIAWNRDRDSHGTHVCGTIVAANDSFGVVGVSPGKANIYMVKVFGDTGNWVYSSTLVAAMQAAVNNGRAKILSMSLGGGRASTTENNACANLYNSGVLLIAAAGNAGNTTTSYPAGYASVVSVAAVDSAKALGSFSQRNSDVEIAAPGVGVLSTVSYSGGSLTVGGQSFIVSAFEGAAPVNATAAIVDGGLATAVNPAWAGKVVLVQRGTNSFAEKVANVQNSGGVGAVVYNNVPGGFSGTLGTGVTSSIPAVSLAQEDGQAIVAGLLGQSATVSAVQAIDVAGHDYFDGTSMATPHVAGVAALLWSKYPSATNAQIRQALQESAEDLGAAGRDNSFGFGLVRAAAAANRLGQILNPPADTTPPVISGAKATAGTKGKFTVSWTTNEPATGTVTASPSLGTRTTALGTSGSVSFTGGTKGVVYTFTITVRDAANNASTTTVSATSR